VQFVEDVIIPLCAKYGKDPREGWHVFQAAYEEHRQQHGSFALRENRNERMLERISYMMVEFFRWLYTDCDEPTVPAATETKDWPIIKNSEHRNASSILFLPYENQAEDSIAFPSARGRRFAPKSWGTPAVDQEESSRRIL